MKIMDRYGATIILGYIVYGALLLALMAIGVFGYRLTIWLIFGPFLVALLAVAVTMIGTAAWAEWHREEER